VADPWGPPPRSVPTPYREPRGRTRGGPRGRAACSPRDRGAPGAGTDERARGGTGGRTAVAREAEASGYARVPRPLLKSFWTVSPSSSMRSSARSRSPLFVLNLTFRFGCFHAPLGLVRLPERCEPVAPRVPTWIPPRCPRRVPATHTVAVGRGSCCCLYGLVFRHTRICVAKAKQKEAPVLCTDVATRNSLATHRCTTRAC
jgi:hypothetical protein